MEKIQRNYRDMSEAQFAAFAAAFNARRTPRSHNPSADGDHFAVYNYGTGEQRFSLHYDRKARAMQATAPAPVLGEIEDTMRAAGLAVVPDAVRPNVFAVLAAPPKQPAPPKKPARPAPTKKRPSRAAKPSEPACPPSAGPARPSAPNGYKDGYSLSGYDRKRLDEGLAALSRASGVTVRVEESNADTPTHTIKAIITRNGDRATVQYAVRRRVVQIQGKPSPLTDSVQSVLSQGADEKAIVQARLAYNAARASAARVSAPAPTAPRASAVTPKSVKKALERSMPNGVRYLSKQSQTYLYYAMIDLESDLANYGGILATAYQGLEHLIATLQTSQGIKVKLIGQAFEKSDGAYTLKASYRRRIGSIVYNEVMSALYTEYFDKRHYYTHSDNVSDTARILTDQATAKREFERLVGVIEYNCKKLSEIGFRIAE